VFDQTAMLLPEEDDRLIRRYFLGDLTEEESREFEARAFIHSEFKTHALIVEDELFEDYAAHLLSRAEREKFERHMLRTPAAREKLNIIGAMLVHQKSASPPSPVLPPAVPFWQRFSWLKFAGPSPAWALAFTAMLLVALLAGSLWYIYRNRDGLTDTARRQQLESEIAALNRQSLQSSDGRQDLLDVILTPGQFRGDDLQTKLTLTEKGLTIRFHLQLPPGRQPTGLRVIVLNGENAEVFSYDAFNIVNSNNQKELVLDVPAHAFGPDDYVIKLRDISTGQDVAGGDYTFRVKRP
jgi:hypothetical protein